MSVADIVRAEKGADRPDDRSMPMISAAHSAELAASAISKEIALEHGVYTAYTEDQLPQLMRSTITRHPNSLPALVFPMRLPDGSLTHQVKPQPGSVRNADGEITKYVSPRRHENPPKLTVLRVVTNPSVVLIVEGVKQALAAVAYAPDDWSIYRIPGIWGWREGDGSGRPTPHLQVVAQQDVVVIPDADARTKIGVYSGARALGAACKDFGASSVRFVRLPGDGNQGLDDLLAAAQDDAERRNLLQELTSQAASEPADQAPAAKPPNTLPECAPERPAIEVGGDLHAASLELVERLIDQRGGDRLFLHGRTLVRVSETHADPGAPPVQQIEALQRSQLRREILDVCTPFTTSSRGTARPVHLQDPLVDLVRDRLVSPGPGRPQRLAHLRAITRSPLVLADGEILARNGYHAQSQMFLDLSSELCDLEVPDHPSDEEIQSAARLIRDDLFAMDGADGYDGWVFATEADRTHAVAGLITPMIRANVDKVPMLLFDGIHRGVGKGGCMEVIHQIAFGSSARIMTARESDDEMEKRIAAVLSTGADCVVLDEVQNEDGRSRLKSTALSAVLTASTYESRKLGNSEMLTLANRASWYGMGNNIQIPGDMIRRVYTCRLASDRDDLETRDNFRHHLETWVPEHRAELLRAVLVLVHAWYDRGEPAAPKLFDFKSFTEWQRIVGGILHLAGFQDFLATVPELRESADVEAVETAAHLQWLHELKGSSVPFTAREVIDLAAADPDAPAPYNLDWVSLTAKKLSTYYGQHTRWYDGLRIRADGLAHRGVRKFVVDEQPARSGGVAAGGPPASGPQAASVTAPAAGAASGETIPAPNGDSATDRVPRAMPPVPGGVRICDLEDGTA
ncbi:DUF3854 domain-containing protein [Helcobacillus massiliensis]|uniref:DNA polymerase-1 n=1 Tax=Helcobacillus massiliensis TaxID=521392 RepID=A0A839QS33_9MICO|nr:DUF3854 domain-containing protein [Helcobacillus massiliensis]MBB3022842.1 DNA polymerase-1 [Helcobacillus massiliensis]